MVPRLLAAIVLIRSDWAAAIAVCTVAGVSDAERTEDGRRKT
jgi:hypothetical protein